MHRTHRDRIFHGHLNLLRSRSTEPPKTPQQTTARAYTRNSNAAAAAGGQEPVAHSNNRSIQFHVIGRQPASQTRLLDGRQKSVSRRRAAAVSGTRCEHNHFNSSSNSNCRPTIKRHSGLIEPVISLSRHAARFRNQKWFSLQNLANRYYTQACCVFVLLLAMARRRWWLITFFTFLSIPNAQPQLQIRFSLRLPTIIPTQLS